MVSPDCKWTKKAQLPEGPEGKRNCSMGTQHPEAGANAKHSFLGI